VSARRSHEADSFRNAFAGIVEAIRSERHMRFHAAATVAVIAVAIGLKVTKWEWLWLSAAITGVWVTELFNTAIERTVDLVSPDRHPLAKAAKDTAAGAVLVAALFAAVIGIIVLGPPVWELLF